MTLKLLAKTEAAFACYINQHRLRKLKNIHMNKCGYVIGNGPSLSMEDLSLIKGKVSIGSNKIYLAFDSTAWRPTYYSIIDPFVAKQISSEIPDCQSRSFYLSGIESYITGRPNTFFVNQLTEGVFDGNRYINYVPGFSSDIPHGIYGGECVTYFNIQLLAYMGCNPIVLTGVDFSFEVPDNSTVHSEYGEIYNQPAAQNHFHRDYRPEGEIWTRPNLREQQLSFTYAVKYLHSRGKILLNATRTTSLKDVPRLSLAEIVNLFQ